MSEYEKSWRPDREKFKDDKGGYITQSLFLEVGYDTTRAMYTFSDEDKEYQGVTYKSLRKLYIEMADPTEYHFATTYLWGWEHWQRIVNNKLLAVEVEKWREELEVKLRAVGVRNIIRQSGDSMVAAKWVADGQWSTTRQKKSKAGQAQEKIVRERVGQEVKKDAERITQLVGRSAR